MSVKQVDLTRLEAMEVWRKALIRTEWFETCAVEEVDVVNSLGRVTAQPVVAVRSVPHYAGSAMDGFAVRAVDTQGATPEAQISLRVIAPGEELVTGSALPVNTGDAIPSGADSVVMKEYVEERGEQVALMTAVAAGQHVRKIGEDIQTGSLVLPTGRVIRPVDIASLLAAAGDRVTVMAKPRVTVIPTGDEIVDSAEKLAPGYIRDINSPMLSALIGSWGADVWRHPIVPDAPETLREAITRSLAVSDLVVMNAGTSGGTEDFAASVLGSLGQVCCHGVAIRPGRPVLLAVVDGKPVIGLPGYPVSCMLTAHLFLCGLIHEFQRKELPRRQLVRATVSQDIGSKPGVEEYLRVTLKPSSPYAEASVLPRGASLISALSQANGMLRIESDCTEISAGEIVEVELF
jgi:putative molybdopterin biosynthesis protein